MALEKPGKLGEFFSYFVATLTNHSIKKWQNAFQYIYKYSAIKENKMK